MRKWLFPASGAGYKSQADIKFCSVSPQIKKRFRCLGVRILQNASGTEAGLQSLRFWEKIEMWLHFLNVLVAYCRFIVLNCCHRYRCISQSFLWFCFFLSWHHFITFSQRLLGQKTFGPCLVTYSWVELDGRSACFFPLLITLLHLEERAWTTKFLTFLHVSLNHTYHKLKTWSCINGWMRNDKKGIRKPPRKRKENVGWKKASLLISCYEAPL